MKNIIALLLFVCVCANGFAQDVIVKKDGTTILAKVMEVNDDVVKYKKHSNQNGPTYSVKVSDLMSINYKNGEKDTFNTPSIVESSIEEYSDVEGASDAELLALAKGDSDKNPLVVVSPEDYVDLSGNPLSKSKRQQVDLHLQILAGKSYRRAGFMVGVLGNLALVSTKAQRKKSHSWLQKNWGCYDKYIKQ